MTGLTVPALRATLHYSPISGAITHKPRTTDPLFTSRHSGRPALASVHRKTGKLFGRILRHQIYAHKAAWAIYYGELRNDIYHRNGNLTENRLDNLRSENALADCLWDAREIDKFTESLSFSDSVEFYHRYQIKKSD